MGTEELEKVVIGCFRENLELSGEEIPPISESTRPACDLKGFDSLRAIEVLFSIENKLGGDLPPDKVFSTIKFEDATVSAITEAIAKLIKESGK